MPNYGFTGTRYGLTNEQARRLKQEMTETFGAPAVYHHGDCVGADKAWHDLIRMYAPDNGTIVGHVPVDPEHRAFCIFDETREPLTHMKRNRAIVAAADEMFATPFEMTEQERGGTWATIRMTRKAGKPLTIVYPDGSVDIERAA